MFKTSKGSFGDMTLFGVSANPLSLQNYKDKLVSATTGMCQFNN